MNFLRRILGRVTSSRSRSTTAFTILLLASSAPAFPATSPGEPDAIRDLFRLLPRLSGELEGKLTALPDHPLSWRLVKTTESAEDATARQTTLSVSGTGFALDIQILFDAEMSKATWRVEAGHVDLAVWLPALAALPELVSAAKGLDATGVVTVAGKGAWSDGTTTGDLRLELKDGVLRNETDGWSLEGVTLNAGGDVASLIDGQLPVELVVGTIRTQRFGARAFTLSARLRNFERAEITSAHVEIAGGEVAAEPFAVALDTPVVDARLSMRGVGLEDIVALVPEALAEGRGHVNGSVRLGWSEAGGVTVREGRLSLADGKPALVRFHPNLGLLTGNLPADVLKLYPGLLRMETGEMPIVASRFDVQFTPDGDENGRSARVMIAGGPKDPAIKAPLVLTINFSGPLAPLIELGSKVNFGAGP